MTKLLFETSPAHRRPRRREGIDPAKALEGMPIPLHPGAERYYKEKGLLK